MTRVAGAQSPAVVRPAPVVTVGDGVVAGSFTAGAFAALAVDRRLAHWTQRPELQRDRGLRRSSAALRLAAQPGLAVALPIVYGVARLRDDRTTASTALHAGEAVVIGSVVTTAIKLTVGRARPAVSIDDPHTMRSLRGSWRSGEFRSFPSGHTTIAFAVASAITAEQTRRRPNDRWSSGVPLYGLASLVGLSRMYDNRHWASDVVAGAGIGTLAGVTVVRFNRTRPDNRVDRWLLGVSLGGDGRAVPLVARRAERR